MQLFNTLLNINKIDVTWSLVKFTKFFFLMDQLKIAQVVHIYDL